MFDELTLEMDLKVGELRTQLDRGIVDQSKTISSRFVAIIDKLKNYRLELVHEYPNIFNRSYDYSRFPDLIEIIKKFAIHSDNGLASDSDETESESSKQTGELVLF